ncbi:hypothetical protein Pint_28516 [Pistacia integerrima]|uniref:Uncharacterized protein n=1 Tax=Pistacia integerrima TaxID=434235 RepID=A0ACC0YT31_9ROSI|nr:hypothetical protein Pint_28516 [Pistacia integerrima]
MSSPREVVTLISSDGVSFKVDKADAIQSGTIKQMIDEDGAGNVFKLHNVDSRVLRMVVFYLKRRHLFGARILSFDKHYEDLLGVKTELTVAAAAAAADADRDLGEMQIKSSAAKVELKNWEATFVMVDQDTLFGLVRAADYLDIPRLLALSKKALFDKFSWDIEIPDDISVIFDNMFESGISYDSV